MNRQIVDYDTPQIIGKSKQKRHRGGKKRRVFAFVVALLLIIVAAISLYFYQPFYIKIPARDYYILILYRTTDTAQAASLSDTVAKSGGGGAILNDDEFLVTAFVYADQNDATSVKNRMIDSYPQADLKNINFARQKIKRFGNRKAEKSFKSLADFPFEFIKEITNLVYALDSFETTESQCIKSLNLLEKTVLEYKESADFLLDSYPSLTHAAHLSNWLETQSENIQNLTNLTVSEHKLTAKLKNLTTKSVFSLHKKVAT